MLAEEKIIEWYNAYSREIFSYLFRFIGNRDDAEDILHDCFAGLIEYARSHDIREETIKPFLYRSAHNRAINHLKMKKHTLTSPLEAADGNAGTIHPHDLLERDELEDAIGIAIANLEPTIRSIFTMKKELGMTVAEIAQNLNISEKTVRRKLEKAMNFLILDLKKSGFEL